MKSNSRSPQTNYLTMNSPVDGSFSNSATQRLGISAPDALAPSENDSGKKQASLYDSYAAYQLNQPPSSPILARQLPTKAEKNESFCSKISSCFFFLKCSKKEEKKFAKHASLRDSSY